MLYMCDILFCSVIIFFFQAEAGIRDLVRSRGLGDVYKRQCPASPSFYSKPATIADLVMTVVDRVLTLAGFVEDSYHWMEDD